jgi:hypothetical protein
MIKKEERSKFLQAEMDEKRISVSYHFIARTKGLDSTIKLLLNQMCNDLYMNGFVTWKHQTYAEHIGISTRQIVRLFNKLTEVGILIPDKDNKVGGKSNKFKLNVSPILIQKLIEKPMTPEAPTYDTDDTQPMTPRVQSCDTDVIYNKPNKTNKVLLGKEESFRDSFSQTRLPEDWLEQLDIKA